jgi:predicted metal-dependent enzyme (double-stranded beta helix superfamily)
VFDLDEFVSDCQTAVAEPQPNLAIKEVLEHAMRNPAAVARVLPPDRAEIIPLHVSPELTVLKVIWAPRMNFRPHNHLMWAAIGLYGGQEDNVFYRRSDVGLSRAGGRELRTGDVALLGKDAIHAVTNPLRTYTGAVHVYGGDLPACQGRSEWDNQTFEELEYDFDRTVRYFEDANARLAEDSP